MPRVELTQRFVDDASGIWSDRVFDRVYRMVKGLGTFPLIGSTDVPRSITREFGEGVRKCVVPPFDLVYEYDEQSDVVYVYGLVPVRRQGRREIRVGDAS